MFDQIFRFTLSGCSVLNSDLETAPLMKANLNLVVAWLWVLLGFVSGAIQGMYFHRENWLGGYASFQRRMYRLAHISFFGLGAVNLLFAVTAQMFLTRTLPASMASAAFIVGAATMPLCCLLMAHLPRTRLLFAVPVLSLITGAVLVLVEIAKL
jgi:hypothetical protein